MFAHHPAARAAARRTRRGPGRRLRVALGVAGAACTLMATSAAQAAALKIVSVGAPTVNCLFDPTCNVAVADSSSVIPLAGVAGTAKLQTRTIKAKAGTPAAGKTIYLYRVDLRQAAGVVNVPCVTHVKIPFGSVVSSIDYDKDGSGGDHVFVITTGGLGSVAPSAAIKTGSTIDFHFAEPVCAGSAPGNGDSSFFFGLASSRVPTPVNATVVDLQNASTVAGARAPKPLVLTSFGGSFLADLGTR